jgi:hypothetical protein
MPHTSLNPLPRRLKLLVLMVVPLTYFAYSLLVANSDWDIDTFLYLGYRLGEGKLLYVADFETKLPLVQYLFWVADKLGGIGAWRTLSFVVALILSYIGSVYLVRRFSAPSQTTPRMQGDKTILVYLFFLVVMYAQPGAYSAQLSLIAGSLMYVAIATWSHCAGQPNWPSAVVSASICAALAVLIRPNYAFAAPFLILLAYGPWQRNPGQSGYRQAAKEIAVFCSVACLVIALAFLPYCFVSGGIAALGDGLRALAGFPKKPLSLLALFGMEFAWKTWILSGFLLGSLCLILAGLGLLARRHRRDAPALSIVPMEIWLCTLSIGGLQLSFMRSQFWDHYALMLVPYAAIVFSYLLSSDFCVRLKSTDGRAISLLTSKRAMIFFLVVFFAPPLSQFFRNAASLIKFVKEQDNTTFSVNNRNVDLTLLHVLSTAKSAGLSFYVPMDVAYHRLLREPRIGDAHPSILYNVLAGKQIGPVGNIYLLSEKVHENPCLAIKESKKDIIVLQKANNIVAPYVLKCLTDPPITYIRADLKPYFSKSEADKLAGRYVIFFDQFAQDKFKSLINK